jgi:YidC/Oxa1 family membrane protein insertase
MERRFLLFLAISFSILMAYNALMARLHPPPPRPGPADRAAPERRDVAEAEKPEKPDRPEEPPEEPLDDPKEGLPAIEQPVVPLQWITLGSADARDPYRMLVTLTNRGAAVARIELSSPRYLDLDDRTGYLGHVSAEPSEGGKGCQVDVVGRGTPAARAGLQPGDLITQVGADRVVDPASLAAALRKTRPGQTVEVRVLREGKPLVLSAGLERRPLEIVKPENDDPLSFQLTLAHWSDRRLLPSENTVEVGEELGGLDLWTAHWEVVSATESEVRFRRVLPQSGLEFFKTYRLVAVPREQINNADYAAYHLELGVELRNGGAAVQKVAYQLDGPTGLPTEGEWYAHKVSRAGGAAGLRDIVVLFDGRTPTMINCPAIAEGKVEKPFQGQPLTFMGVDAQYFSVVLLPKKEDPREIWLAMSHPLRVGKVDPARRDLTNTSFRLISQAHELEPGGRVEHRYTVFAGPKKREILTHYGLEELIYYGWFTFLAKPMAWILHFFHSITFNYALAIILLTVVVRGGMYPVSRKQALGAQKMQELQPEIKRIAEKYKNNMEARTKAQQELFRKHNYNPLSGCLVMFIQLPVFIALYRTLMVDVELRGSPLLSESIRWCSNLAAPDMLYDWSWFMPEWVNQGHSIWSPGPYFNILPILTIALFIWQQKMFMPPPTDEQSAMQQKVMKYMMVFMGVLFFKVASGLCIYFIASSLWGLAERKLLPKTAAPEVPTAPQSRADAKAEARADSRGETKDAARPGAFMAWLLGKPDDGDGASSKGRRNRGRRR